MKETQKHDHLLDTFYLRIRFGEAWHDYAAWIPASFPFVGRHAPAFGEEMGCGCRPRGPQ
jgi:hypothetical protein